MMRLRSLTRAAVAAMALSGLHPAGGADAMDSGGHEHAGHATPHGPALTGRSVYQLDDVWTTQGGESRTLGELAGRVVVLAMVYTHCEHACPRIIADMRRIAKEVEADPGELAFVLVSIDPERDTVERLRRFGEQTGLTELGWTLLRGDPPQVRTLAALFGVKFRRVSPEEFAHSNLVSVLDRKGEIVHQQVGLGTEPTETVRVIRGLLETGRPSDSEAAR